MQKLSTVVIAALLLAACNSGLGTKAKEAAAPAPSPLPATSTVNGQGPQAAPGATSVALNPPHGQPGHSCDIPEGAPLNSIPAQGSALPATGINMQTAPATPVAGERINPPHGQPGHSCDVPVGQPLN